MIMLILLVVTRNTYINNIIVIVHARVSKLPILCAVVQIL